MSRGEGPAGPDPSRASDRVRLESKIAFLEHTVDALNEVALEQGRAIETLERRLARVEERLVAGGEEEGDPRQERPPHY